MMIVSSHERGGEIAFQKSIKNRVASLKRFSLTSPKVPQRMIALSYKYLQWSSLLAQIYLFDKKGQELEKEGGFDDHDAAVP